MSVLPLEIIGISKKFGAVEALKGVGLSIAPGECLAVVGENGAGKSTLMKIMAGVEQPDKGSILIDGVETNISNPRQASEMGICLVHQELIFVPELSIAQNIFLGREESRNGFIRRKVQKERASELLDELGLHIDVDTPMSRISASEQQLVEIAKGLSQNAELVILDEPTSSLASAEVERLFSVIRALLKKRKSVVYISHRVDEIGVIADRVMVMRDGQVAGNLPAGANSKEVVSLMIGRELNKMYPKASGKAGSKVLEVEHLSSRGLWDICFSLHKGEILGIGGLVGAGQRTLSHVLFGIQKIKEGGLYLHDNAISLSNISPEYMVEHGIVYVGEDRRQEGLNLKKNIFSNMTLPVLERFSKGGFLKIRELENRSLGLMDKLRIRAQSIHQLVTQLSGGNQQKVVLGKALISEPEILILVEPTRGIDVGARADIYDLLKSFASEGKAILMISSDLDELKGMSDRLVILYRGQIAGELNRKEATMEKITLLATGQSIERAS